MDVAFMHANKYQIGLPKIVLVIREYPTKKYLMQFDASLFYEI